MSRVLHLAVIAVLTWSIVRVPIIGVDPILASEFGDLRLEPLLSPLLLFPATQIWPAYRRLLLVLAFAVVGVLAFGEAVRYESARIGLQSLVLEPGYGFLLLHVLTAVAQAAALWLFMSLIDSLEGVRGWLWVLGIFALDRVGSQCFYDGYSFTTGAGFGWTGFTVVLLCIAAGLFAGTRQTAEGWIRGALGAVMLPAIGAAAIWDWTLSAWHGAAGALVGFVLVLGTMRSRPWQVSSGVWAAMLPALTLLSLPAGVLANPTGLARQIGPGPFDGDVTATVQLSSANPGVQDLRKIRDRLAVLGVSHTLTDSGELTLRDVYSIGDVLDVVLPPNRVTFRAEVPSDPELVAEVCYGQHCSSIDLGPVVLGSEHLGSANIFYDQMNQPAVSLEFTAVGKQMFADFSTTHVKERFAILLDGDILTAPVIAEPITGGRAVVSLEPGKEGLDLGMRITSAVEGGHLQGDWSVE